MDNLKQKPRVHTVSEDKYEENSSDNRNGWIGEYGRYIKQWSESLGSALFNNSIIYNFSPPSTMKAK